MYSTSPHVAAELLAAMEDYEMSNRPRCFFCQDPMFFGERFSRMNRDREEVLVCEYCLKLAVKDMEVFN